MTCHTKHTTKAKVSISVFWKIFSKLMLAFMYKLNKEKFSIIDKLRWLLGFFSRQHPRYLLNKNCWTAFLICESIIRALTCQRVLMLKASSHCTLSVAHLVFKFFSNSQLPLSCFIPRPFICSLLYYFLHFCLSQRFLIMQINQVTFHLLSSQSSPVLILLENLDLWRSYFLTLKCLCYSNLSLSCFHFFISTWIFHFTLIWYYWLLKKFSVILFLKSNRTGQLLSNCY